MKKPPLSNYTAHYPQPKSINYGLILFIIVAALIAFYLINKNSKDEV